MIHILKTWSTMFSAIASGAKTHEIRKTDRDYNAGDVLHLREYVPHTNGTGVYTGRTIDAYVSFVTPGGEWGIPDGLCVMSIRTTEDARAELARKS